MIRSWKKTTAPCLVALALGAAACGDRPDIYDVPVEAQLQAFALEDRVAVVDRPGNRVALLTPKAGQALDRTFVPIGKGAVRTEASPDQKRLFVLSPLPQSATPLGKSERVSQRLLPLQSPRPGDLPRHDTD